MGSCETPHYGLAERLASFQVKNGANTYLMKVGTARMQVSWD